MMLIVTNKKTMKAFAATRALAITGWAATAAMLIAVLALGATSFF